MYITTQYGDRIQSKHLALFIGVEKRYGSEFFHVKATMVRLAEKVASYNLAPNAPDTIRNLSFTFGVSSQGDVGRDGVYAVRVVAEGEGHSPLLTLAKLIQKLEKAGGLDNHAEWTDAVLRMAEAFGIRTLVFSGIEPGYRDYDSDTLDYFRINEDATAVARAKLDTYLSNAVEKYGKAKAS